MPEFETARVLFENSYRVNTGINHPVNVGLKTNFFTVCGRKQNIITGNIVEFHEFKIVVMVAELDIRFITGLPQGIQPGCRLFKIILCFVFRDRKTGEHQVIHAQFSMGRDGLLLLIGAEHDMGADHFHTHLIHHLFKLRRRQAVEFAIAVTCGFEPCIADIPELPEGSLQILADLVPDSI